MSRLLKTALFGSLILAIPTLTLAQAKQGDKDVSLSGKFSSLRSSGPTISSGEFDLGLGYFVTDRVEIAVAPTFNVSATTPPIGRQNPTARTGKSTVASRSEVNSF